MPDMNLIEAVSDALRSRCAAIRGWSCWARTWAGSAACSARPTGLQDEFGAERCIDTPLAESGIVGTAIGMALYGMRPVPEIQFARLSSIRRSIRS